MGGSIPIRITKFTKRKTECKVWKKSGENGEFIIQLLGDEEANAATLKLLDKLKVAPARKEWKALGFVNIVVLTRSA